MYEKFLIQNPPYFGDFAEVIFFDTVKNEITTAWKDLDGNKVGGITQVLQLDNKRYLFGSDSAPALMSLKL